MNKFIEFVQDAWDTYCFLMHSFIEDYSFGGVLLGAIVTGLVLMIIGLISIILLFTSITCPSIMIGIVILCIFVSFANRCYEKAEKELKINNRELEEELEDEFGYHNKKK